MRTLVIVCSALAVGAADANAARYVATPAGGGRIVVNVADGRLLRMRAALPAGCESNNGRSWDSRLAVDLGGDLALRSGRFRIHGQTPSKVRYDIGGRLRNGAISGRARLTFLDLDYVGPSDDSFLCDTGTRRYRARR